MDCFSMGLNNEDRLNAFKKIASELGITLAELAVGLEESLKIPDYTAKRYLNGESKLPCGYGPEYMGALETAVKCHAEKLLNSGNEEKRKDNAKKKQEFNDNWESKKNWAAGILWTVFYDFQAKRSLWTAPESDGSEALSNATLNMAKELFLKLDNISAYRLFKNFQGLASVPYGRHVCFVHFVLSLKPDLLKTLIEQERREWFYGNTGDLFSLSQNIGLRQWLALAHEDYGGDRKGDKKPVADSWNGIEKKLKKLSATAAQEALLILTEIVSYGFSADAIDLAISYMYFRQEGREGVLMGQVYELWCDTNNQRNLFQEMLNETENKRLALLKEYQTLK